ncbi:hypothetical protein MG293_017355 [Ovis ammon polii]|uniref:Uncharacterized protein n=1 Tax=Ovis ammon polii TaxID=230172 RepID=A0AAD4XZJ9_OVIAM|nr:hypothetical protein MG293_017355 [Ovis ammon polii]
MWVVDDSLSFPPSTPLKSCLLRSACQVSSQYLKNINSSIPESGDVPSIHPGALTLLDVYAHSAVRKHNYSFFFKQVYDRSTPFKVFTSSLERLYHCPKPRLLPLRAPRILSPPSCGIVRENEMPTTPDVDGTLCVCMQCPFLHRSITL